MEDRPNQSRRQRQRHRSRSSSFDSQVGRQRRQSSKDRTERHGREDRMGRQVEYESLGDSREQKNVEGGGKSDSARRRHREDEQPGRKRRRTHSPDRKESRRHEDRSSKHRARRNRSPEPRDISDRDSRFPRDEGKMQVTVKKSGPLPSQELSFSMNKDPSKAVQVGNDIPLQEKQKPNFAPSGLLAAETNTVAKADGTTLVLKYHEPPEARKPLSRDQWKLFVFKGADIVDTIELSLRSCWLVGREISVVDLLAEHPSISKQHAVLQFRYIEKRNEFGDKLGKVRPYLIDLESANGTMLNKERVPESRYLELRDKDMIQFGESTREYVLMLPPKD